MNVLALKLPRTVMLALLCIAGSMGNGEDRKRNVKTAGGDPEKVQKCVNELLPILNKYGGA